MMRMLVATATVLLEVALSESAIVLSEIASKGGGDVCDGKDWIELKNTGQANVDIAGYKLCDDKGSDHIEAYTIPAGTSIPGNGYMLICKVSKKSISRGFVFGIGGDDTITLLDTSGNVLDTSKLPGDSGKTWALKANGMFDYVNNPTPGSINDETAPVIVETPGCRKGQPCWDLFDQNIVRTYELAIHEHDRAIMDEDLWAETYVPCNVTVNAGTKDAQTLFGAGCRYKGSKGGFFTCVDEGRGGGSRMRRSALCRKVSIKVDANQFNRKSSQRFNGLKKLQFHGMVPDPSLLAERLTYNWMQRTNYMVSRAMHARLVINGVPDGLYLHVEQVDDVFLEARHGQNERNMDLFKELWITGCEGKWTKKGSIPKGGCGDTAHCQSEECSSCWGKKCEMQVCHEGTCYHGRTDERCKYKSRGHPLEDLPGTWKPNTWCYDGQRHHACKPLSEAEMANVDCTDTYRKSGNSKHSNLFSSLHDQASFCVARGSKCSAAEAAQILEDHLNTSSWIDGLVSGSFLDNDQWLTFYGVGKHRGTHNFYQTVYQPGGPETARISLISWDFDRCWGICKTKTCIAGGTLGNLMFQGTMGNPRGWDWKDWKNGGGGGGGDDWKKDLMSGGLPDVPWTNCETPPWWVNTVLQPSLYEKYCVKGVQTFAEASHPACDPVVNLMGRAWKEKYAERMRDLLNGAEEWGHAQLSAYVLQIEDFVSEDSAQGGQPSVNWWKSAVRGTKERFTEVVELGRNLASAALEAHQMECNATENQTNAATCNALRCFGSEEPCNFCTFRKCDVGAAGSGSDECQSLTEFFESTSTSTQSPSTQSPSNSKQSPSKALSPEVSSAMPHRFRFYGMLAIVLSLCLRQ